MTRSATSLVVMVISVGAAAVFVALAPAPTAAIRISGDAATTEADMTQGSSSPLPDPTVGGVADALGIAPNEAGGVLELQATAGMVDDAFRDAMPDAYGGRWYDFDEGRAKFGVTGDVARAGAIVGEFDHAERMDVVVVAFSLAELEAASRELGTIIEQSGLRGIEAGVVTSTNAVVIGLPSPVERSEAHQRILDDAVAAYGTMIDTETLPAEWRVNPDS